MVLPGRLVSVAALLFLFAAPAFSQQQQAAPAAGETIEVSIINVDVFVTDRKGNRVYGLSRDDFEIRENGKMQPISNFAEYVPETNRVEGTVTVDGPAATTPPHANPPVAARRTIVIFIELVPHPLARLQEVFASLRDFVRTAVRPGDAATIVAYDGKLSTRQPFTDDTAALAAALARLEKQSIGVAPDTERDFRIADAGDEAAAMALSSFGKATRGGSAKTGQLDRDAFELEELVKMRHKSAALTSVLESMSGVEGKKVMVMAMDRFGLSLGERTPPNFKMDTLVERLRQAVMRTANANAVTLYPIYAQSLSHTSDPNVQEERPNVLATDSDRDLGRAAFDHAALMNQGSSLRQIAMETGGLMAAGPHDIAALMPHVVDDLESYYSLAYKATPAVAGAKRNIVVTAKNRDYEVRSRHSIVEKSDDTQMDDRVVANLFQPLERSAIPIQVTLGTISKSSRGLWSVPVVVRIPISALTALPGDKAATGAFSVFVGTGGDFGVISDVQHRTQPYSIRLEDLVTARSAHFTYNVTVEFDRLADAVSVGVRDDVSKEYGLVRTSLPGRSINESTAGAKGE
jgi:VWFA-related protein